MIKCIAIDDEPKALEIIKTHVSKLNTIELISSFNDPLEAMSYLNENSIDLIFLDVNMPNISGLELLKSLRNPPMVIFTTAHSEYAVASYEFRAVDYLLKPFDFPRFAQAVNKAFENLKYAQSTSSNFMFVNTGNQKQKLVFDDILYAQADGNYVRYVTHQGRILVRSSIKDVLNLLHSSDFIQIHRSYIVSISKIQKIEDNHVYIADQKISISYSFRDSFLGRIGL